MKHLMIRISVVLVLITIVVMGCAIMMPTAVFEHPESVSAEDIVAAAAVALQEQEYPVMTVNDRIGLVTTDWKDITSTGSQIAQALLVGRVAHTRMKVTITVDKTTRRVNLKPLKQAQNGYGGWGNAKLSDGDFKKLNIVITRLRETVGMPESVVWIQP